MGVTLSYRIGRKMPYKVLCLAVMAWYLGALVGYGQNAHALDSLMSRLYGAKGSARLEILNALPGLMLQDHPEQALGYIREAQRLAFVLGDEEAQGTVWFNYGWYYHANGAIDSALNYHRLALQVRMGHGGAKGDERMAQSLNGIGAAFDDKGLGDSALAYYMQALVYAERIENSDVLSSVLSNMGTNQFDRGDYGAAVRSMKRVLEIDLKRHAEADAATTMSNIGMGYVRLKQLDSALYYHQEALGIRQRLNNVLDVAKSLNNIGVVYREMSNRHEAADYFMQSLELKRTVGNTFEVARTLNNLGGLYNEMGRFRDALVYLKEAQGIVDTLQAQPVRLSTYRALSQSYAGMGAFELAYGFQMTADSIRASVDNAEREARIADLVAKYESSEKEKQIAILQSQSVTNELEAAKLRQRMYLLIGSLVVVFLLGIVVLVAFLLIHSRNQKLQQLNRALEERNHEIAGKNAEIRQQSMLLAARHAEIKVINTHLEEMVVERTAKLQQSNWELDTFLYQSSHALRGPLMRIAGLVNIVQEGQTSESMPLMLSRIDYTVHGMDRMLHKLMDAAEIHRRVLHPDKVDFKKAVSETVDLINQWMDYAPCVLRTDLPDTLLPVPDRFLFESILHNLLENALHFRHAERDHVVEVKAELMGGVLRLMIRDNGIGIPEGQLRFLGKMFHRASAQSAGMGLGLYVVRMALERVDGRIVHVTEEGHWTEVVVEMRLGGEMQEARGEMQEVGQG